MPWSGFSYNWRHDTDNSVFVGSRPANRVCRTARHWFHADNCFHTCPSSNNRTVSLPTPIPPLVGSAAPDFAFKLFQGEDQLGKQDLRLSELDGRPIVLNFWARFCGPCWTEMPELQYFYEEYSGELILLGIDVGQFTGLGSPKDAGRLLGSLGVTYPAGYTDDASVVRDYRVRAMPTTIFISAEGKIFRTWTGSITREDVTTIVREMLAEG